MNWKRFRRMWDNYEIASQLKKEKTEQRIATLLVCIGPEALDSYYGLDWQTTNDCDEAVDKSRDIDYVLQMMEEYFIGETNEIYERYCFNKRQQHDVETVDAYVTALRTMAKTCNYGQLEDSLIRDRIVVGMRDNQDRKKFLQQSKLSLKACMDICRAYETTAHQLKAMTEQEPEAEEVHVIKKDTGQADSRGQDKGQQQAQGNPVGGQQVTSCRYCGRHHERRKERCPAWGKNCLKCKIILLLSVFPRKS